MIYMVENGFADSARELAWNTWYTQHVTHTFHSVPGWRTGQRFVALPPSQPKYRAMYTLDSAEVLTSPAYQATTHGRFPDTWRSMITDFHRNLADGDCMPAVEKDQYLIVADPPATGLELTEIALQWWNVVGLDRSVTRRAIGVVDRASGDTIARRALPGVGVYAPLFDRYVV